MISFFFLTSNLFTFEYKWPQLNVHEQYTMKHAKLWIRQWIFLSFLYLLFTSFSSQNTGRKAKGYIWKHLRGIWQAFSPGFFANFISYLHVRSMVMALLVILCVCRQGICLWQAFSNLSWIFSNFISYLHIVWWWRC